MNEGQSSRTALRVALRRAAHQVLDARPLVFEDPLAVRILGPEMAQELKRTPPADRRPFSAGLRAWMVTRARLAEDVLRTGVEERGVQQALVLGAGLDTFAYRNPFPDVRVFEIDHPETQAWKREKLKAAGIPVPPSMRFVPVDFERHSLRQELLRAGFDPGVPTATAWLGVVPYLTAEAFAATARVLGRFAEGSTVVFDYSLPREALPSVEQLMLDSLAARVAKAGEPFQLFFTPESLGEDLPRYDLRVCEDLDTSSLTARYLHGRTDGLVLRGTAARVCVAASVRPE